MPRESTIQILRSTTTDIPAGLTFGELAYSTVNNRVFIGDQTGNSVWVGAGITTGTIATNSTVLVPTQSAVKTYVDGIVGGGSVVNSVNGTAGNITVTGDGQSGLVTVSGTTTTITNRLATTTATGVASFNTASFAVTNGDVTIKSGGVSNTQLVNSSVTVSPGSGLAGGGAVALGSSITLTNIGVTSFNGATGAVTYAPPVATSSVTGVASFNTTDFTVASGAVSLKGAVTSFNGATGSVSYYAPIASASATGVASFDTNNFTVSAAGAVALRGAVTSINGATGAYALPVASTSVTGVASFDTNNFSITAGAVSLKGGGVPNTALVNSSFTLRDEVGGTDTISLGDTLTITGGRGVDFIRTTTDTYEVRGITATSSVLGVASFDSNNFTVTNGAVALRGAVTSINGSTGAYVLPVASASVTGVASFAAADFTVSAAGAVNIRGAATSVNGATGAISVTGDGGSQVVSISGTTTTITNRIATTGVTGVASFDTNNFSITAGAVSLKGGGVPNTALANSSITVFANASNTINLGGTLTITGTANQVAVSSSSGTVTLGLPNDITIPGNLTVNGTVVTANVDSFVVEDPLFMLGTGNSADSVDIGFYGKYVSSGTRFTGLFRDASDSGKYKLFANLTGGAEPTSFVNDAGAGYSVATLVAKIDGGTF